MEYPWQLNTPWTSFHNITLLQTRRKGTSSKTIFSLWRRITILSVVQREIRLCLQSGAGYCYTWMDQLRFVIAKTDESRGSLRGGWGKGSLPNLLLPGCLTPLGHLYQGKTQPAAFQQQVIITLPLGCFIPNRRSTTPAKNVPNFALRRFQFLAVLRLSIGNDSRLKKPNFMSKEKKNLCPCERQALAFTEKKISQLEKKDTGEKTTAILLLFSAWAMWRCFFAATTCVAANNYHSRKVHNVQDWYHLTFLRQILITIFCLTFPSPRLNMFHL